MKKLIYYIIAALLLVACANIAGPDGGPYDEDPPKVVRTSPKFGAVNSKATKIVLEFNEMVKLENASENVIISPPQLEQPDIEAVGRKITIKLLDSIKPNTTYTIDFADAIKDNNEGNSMGDYAFTFSSGSEIDTMQVSGYVLDASNLEPIKGIMVGVYDLGEEGKEIPFEHFCQNPLERVSRTDEGGHFVIKGLRNSNYRVFALKDQNQNFMYDQKSEMLAYSYEHYKPTAQPDIKPDTVWHDSIHYDSIIYRGFTHFYPDDITLMAFTSTVQDRYLVKYERPQLNMFSLLFSSGSDTLPKLTGMNFDVDSAFVIDASERNDTINYWIRDSLVYNLDTLMMQIDFFATDTTGQLALTIDTLVLSPKVSKAKLEKEKEKAWEEYAKEYRKQYRAEMKAKQAEAQVDAEEPKESTEEGVKPEEETDSGGEEVQVEEGTDKIEEETSSNSKGNKDKKKKKEKKEKIKDEDIPIPPMPEELMDVKVDPNSLDPDKNVTFTFMEPIDSVDMGKISFFTKRDSLEIPEKFEFRKVEGKQLKYELLAEWQPDSTYYLKCDTGMFVNIYGKRSNVINKNFKVGSLDSYSTLFVLLQNADKSAVVELLDASDKVVKTIVSQNGKADFYFLKPGKYYMRMFYDYDGNGKWDAGDYDAHRPPEDMFYYPKMMELKAQWEITQTFNPKELPLFKQKPLAITKQKDVKKDKTKKSKNQQRLEEKMNRKKGTTSSATSNLRF